MTNLNGNKKILISVASFVLVIAVIVSVLLILGGKQNGSQSQEQSTLSGGSVAVQTDGLTETLTSPPVTTSPAMNNSSIAIGENEAEIMNAYTNGVFYIDGYMSENGSAKTPLTIAISGNNFHTTTDMDGQEMGVIYLNQKVYFVDEKNRTYFDIDSLLSLVGESGSLDVSMLDEVAQSINMSKYSFDEMKKEEVTLDSLPATCYRFYNPDIILSFYFVAGEIKRIEMCNADGEVGMQLDINTFYPYVPANMLTLNGLKKANITDILGMFESGT